MNMQPGLFDPAHTVMPGSVTESGPPAPHLCNLRPSVEKNPPVHPICNHQSAIRNLKKLNSSGTLSVQYIIARHLAQHGFVTSRDLRVWMQNWRTQCITQRLRDLRHVFHLDLIGPLDKPLEIRDAARARLPESSDRQKLYIALKLRPTECDGRCWILSPGSRTALIALVANAAAESSADDTDDRRSEIPHLRPSAKSVERNSQ